MTETEVYTDLTELFRDLFGDDEIVLTAETTANDIDDWDSFNHLNIIVGVEMRYGIKLQTKEVESLTNVGDMARLILAKTGGR